MYSIYLTVSYEPSDNYLTFYRYVLQGHFFSGRDLQNGNCVRYSIKKQDKNYGLDSNDWVE